MLGNAASQKTRELRPIEIEVLREAVEPRLPSDAFQLTPEELLYLSRRRPPAEGPFLHGVVIGAVVSFPFALILGIASAHWLS